MVIVYLHTACEMKYYDFVSYGWCHIRERPARLVSNAFLYTTSVGKAYQLEANHLREGILTRKYRREMSSF